MTGLSSSGLTFCDEQRLQLGQHCASFLDMVISLLWIGGEIVQLDARSDHRHQPITTRVALLVIMIQFPDLLGTIGAGWECGNDRLDSRRLLDGLIRSPCEKIDLMGTTAHIVFRHEVNRPDHIGL